MNGAKIIFDSVWMKTNLITLPWHCNNFDFLGTEKQRLS